MRPDGHAVEHGFRCEPKVRLNAIYWVRFDAIYWSSSLPVGNVHSPVKGSGFEF